MKLRKKSEVRPPDHDEEDEVRLATAETRAETLFSKAVQLKTIVSRRDQANHWQAAVNELFSGGKT